MTMSTEASSPSGGFYPATHWTQIYQARELEKTAGRNALGELLTRYRKALLHHLIWKFQTSPEQAEDWLHSFVEKKFLEYQLVQLADKARGRFRGFILSALDRFVADDIEKQNAKKRKPDQGFASLEEAACALDSAEHQATDPGDIEWARSVVVRALSRTQAWYESQGDRRTWAAFDLGRIQPLLKGADRPSNARLAADCGLDAEQVSNVINNASRKFRTELRSIVREYARDESEVEQELHCLIEFLRQPASNH